LLILGAAWLGGCGVVSKPFKADNVATFSACEVDLRQPIALERITFRVPEFWSRLTPCERLQVGTNTKRDAWMIEAPYEFGYDGIVVQDRAAAFGIGSAIHLIGKERLTPETWLPEARERWKQGDKGHRVDRQIERVRHGDLDCWRVVRQSYNSDSGVEAQSYGGMSYACWPDGDDAYPPIQLSASMRYVDERPLYDIDIDRDLLLPVLESLEIRELSPEAYAARKQAYAERELERCKDAWRYARRIGAENIGEGARENLRGCGYDPDTLKRIEPR
jgi:hypothetical protein